LRRETCTVLEKARHDEAAHLLVRSLSAGIIKQFVHQLADKAVVLLLPERPEPVGL
jgi:hypothetical protein